MLIKSFIAVGLMAALALITGCAGVGVKAEMYRIDQRQEQVSTIDKPISCLWNNCNGGK